MTSRPSTRLQEQQNAPPAAGTRSTRQRLPLNRNQSREIATTSNTSSKRKPPTVDMAPAKKATKRSKKTTDAATKAKKVKQKNFTTHEDVLLCKAYVNISTNPVAGTGKKAKDFWKSIKETFDALMKAEPPEDNEGIVERDQEALMNRFKRHIQKKMNVFNKYFKQVKQEGPSGTPYDEYIDLAMEKYLEEEGRPFPFKECVPILHQMPKFDPMVEVEEIVIDDDDEDDDDGDPSTPNSDKKPAAVNSIGAPMGAGMPRPPGAKASKRAMKEEQSLSSIETNKVMAMERLAGSHEQLASALNRNNELQAAKNKQDSLFRMFDMYRAMGNMTKAQECMDELQKMQQQEQAVVAAPVPAEVATGTEASAAASAAGGGSGMDELSTNSFAAI